MASIINSDNFDIKKVLKEDGVYAYGFGHIAKVAMLDRDLSCVAKGIYAYFCSYTNAKNSAYPKITTILNDLGIDKKTYYKHFDQLVENGYISIKKADGYKNKNVYIINEYVKKVNLDFSEENNSESEFIVDGIKAHGYGTIPKLLMIDKRLTIKAKALMAFLLSLTGAGRRAFPRRDAICLHIGVSLNTYKSMMNELISCGYIKVTQRRTRGGTFTINDYHFEVNPVEAEKEEVQKIVDVDNSGDVDKNVKICGKLETTVNNCIEAATESSSKNGLNSENSPWTNISPFLENGLNSEVSPRTNISPFLNDYRGTNIPPLPWSNNSPSNNINNNNNSIMQGTSILSPDIKVIKDRMPEGKELIDTLHIISNYDLYREYSDSYANKHCKVVDILVNIFSEKAIIHKEEIIMPTVLWKYFIYVLKNGYSTDKPCVDFIYDILVYYEQCLSIYNIEHPARYLKTLIIDRIISFYDESILS